MSGPIKRHIDVAVFKQAGVALALIAWRCRAVQDKVPGDRHSRPTSSTSLVVVVLSRRSSKRPSGRLTVPRWSRAKPQSPRSAHAVLYQPQLSDLRLRFDSAYQSRTQTTCHDGRVTVRTLPLMRRRFVR